MIDSSALSRHGLLSALGEYPEFQVVGDAANVSEAFTKLGELQPDIVITDVFMPGGGGVNDISRLQQRFPDIKVLIFTASNNRDEVFKSITAGACGYMMKTAELTEVIESIRLVASGNAIVFPSATARILTQLRNTGWQNINGFKSLSPNEKETLGLVAQGATNREIAEQCQVSETMVKARLTRILDKLNAKNRTQAVALATTRGLLDSYNQNSGVRGNLQQQAFSQP
jgi:two-component system response regulator NreC